MSYEEADLALCIAHTAVDKYLVEGERWEPNLTNAPEFLKEVRGAFVTLYRIDMGIENLRGCIGFPLPIYPLGKALALAAISAAVSDPRFPPVRVEELPLIEFSVDILSPLEKIDEHDPVKLAKIIIPGKHGLVVKYKGMSGLLLPKVATEYGWGPIEFLEHTCMKAGLPRNYYLKPETEIYLFTSESYTDKELIEYYYNKNK